MTSQAYQEQTRIDIGDVLIAVGLVVPVAVLGQVAISPNLTWYHSLIAPSFGPPDWTFGSVWALMYAMMAYASWRVLSLMELSPDRSIALLLYFVALLLNVCWSFGFFVAQNSTFGLVDIALEWGVFIATIGAFARLDLTAALFMVPPLVWVSFTAVMNFEIWRLNG